MIAGLFERGQHEDGLFHLGEAVTSDAQDLTATRHQVGEKCDVTSIDGHAVALHRVVDLRHDRLAGGLNAQDGRHLVGIVRGCFTRFYSWRGQNLSEVVALDKKLVFVARAALRVVDVNDCTVDSWKALDDHGG